MNRISRYYRSYSVDFKKTVALIETITAERTDWLPISQIRAEAAFAEDCIPVEQYLRSALYQLCVHGILMYRHPPYEGDEHAEIWFKRNDEPIHQPIEQQNKSIIEMFH